MKRASCGLLYGAMNTTKTTQLGRIARYLYEKYGFISRLISADNEYDTLEDLISAGVIEPWAILNIPSPFPKLTKLSQGMWPLVNTKTGQIELNPTAPEKLTRTPYLIEGTTTIGELCRQNHIEEARTLGGDPVGKWTEEGINFARANQSHYGQVQDFVTMDLIPGFSMLPVPWVWWTGHEYYGEDEATGKTRLGPGVVGKAATSVVPRKLGNTFHLVITDNAPATVTGRKNVLKEERRAYFERHPSAEMIGVNWPAGVKIPPMWIDAWKERFPEGYISLTLDKGMEQYLEFHDEIAAKQTKLVITPGQQMYRQVDNLPGKEAYGASNNPGGLAKAGESPEPAPIIPGGYNPGKPLASQTVPPRRQPLPPLRRPLVGGSYKDPQGLKTNGPVAVPDTLSQTLVKSIEQVTGLPLPELPDINAISEEQSTKQGE